ncbi:tyrosine-type recombinase/integrase [Frankia sp. Cj5]|uniref:tyrosine-type recombinase/integrase n=1 Tax=Frankia sp. Cj5 TaxID=2880978 RepID=UPI001EF480C5|nr:tyrosine-type recombinase/integrase [Frankia sp. Cj5]
MSEGGSEVAVRRFDSDDALSPDLVERVADYARAARAPSTWRAYETDLRHFGAWCADQSPQLAVLPASPETVAGYLAALADAGYKPTTIRRRLAAISVAHQLGRHPNPASSPEAATVWDGIRRTHGAAPNRKNALETRLLTQVLAELDGSRLADIRDRALLLVGFAGCLRRSELVALDLADIAETPDGVILTIRRSKTDQDASGALVGLTFGSYRPTCPVRSWIAWRETAGITHGPAFRAINRHGGVSSGRLYPGSVARIVQRRVAAAGLSPTDFAGHSLRSGFATAAARAGVPDRAIMRQGRWRSSTSLDSYVRAGRLFDRDNPSGKVGL